MSENDEKSHGHIQASDNSNAIGGDIVISGVIQDSSHIHVGHTIGYSAEQVSVLITQITTTFQPKPFDGRCPYMGLDAFDEEDAELFFGREKLVEDLVSRVKGSQTVFVTGPSGSGKSSLVRAGLIPTLKQGAIKASNSDRWLYATLKPGRDPFEALANAFSRLKSPELGNYLREHADRVTVLHECAESVLTERKDQRLVLFIDQFEEVFTQLSRDKTEMFVNLLAHAATIENGRMIILFSMRSDFVPNCATYPQLNALLNRQFVQIGAMQPEELVSAIAQPALRVGLQIDPDLIAQIINDMKGEPGSLPLVQFALKDLFDEEQARVGMIALTREAYLKRGGIQKSLERHAEAAFAGLGEGEQELARSIFSGLIEIGRGTQDTRRTANFDELIPASAKAEEVQAIVHKLADARLITTDQKAGNDTVSISHEKLIDAWPWLRKLVNENRDMIALQNEIAEDAKEWEKHSQDASYLYIGARLTNAREKLEIRKLVLSGLAQAFVEAGIEIETAKAQEEKKRRQKELEDAHTLAETAQAQAQAERRARLITNGVLVAAIILVGVLSYNPIRNELWRREAMKSEMISIPAGDYLLGDQQRTEEYPDDYLVYQKYSVAAFSIDSYPVTNKRYVFCIQAGICSRPDSLTTEYKDERNADKPVVNITSIDAAEFCNWIGLLLPSDKEWEVAASQISNILPTPDSRYSAEYFFEWTRSPYDQDQSEWTDLSKDPPELLTQKGGFLDEPIEKTMTLRRASTSTGPESTTGFRCVISH